MFFPRNEVKTKKIINKRSSPQFETIFGRNLGLFELADSFSSEHPGLDSRWGDASPLQFKYWVELDICISTLSHLFVKPLIARFSIRVPGKVLRHSNLFIQGFLIYSKARSSAKIKIFIAEFRTAVAVQMNFKCATKRNSTFKTSHSLRDGVTLSYLNA